MSRFGMLVVSVAIVVLVALPLLTLATQFLEQVERLATWSPPQLLAFFGGLLVVKLIVLLSLGRMVRRSAE
jgi:protein-S-isoprenylcysteine O-methyltransferase Ste14